MGSNQTMSIYLNHLNHLKEIEKREDEIQKREDEIEEYEEAFNRLSKEEQIIISKVTRKITFAKFEESRIKRNNENKNQNKKQIEQLTKIIENDRIENDRIYTERCNKITKASFCIGVLAYIGLTIITR